MGIFNFLKKNKNIITDNGINYIYYDNGKGLIKDKFNKVNGKLHGEYLVYDRFGEVNVKNYDNGLEIMSEKEVLQKIQKIQKEQIATNIEVEINYLKKIDDTISEITGIDLLVQMENSKIKSYATLIKEKYKNDFDEDYIRFYSIIKRNYFIKELICYGKSNLFNEYKELDYNELINSYNLDFTNFLNNYLDRINVLENIKISHSDSYFVESAILFNLFTNLTTENFIYCNGSGIDRIVFNQNSFLIGLKFDTYIKLNYLIKEKSNYKFDDKNYENELDTFQSLLNDVTSLKPSKMDNYVQNVVKEIKLICVDSKFNQDDINLKI
jgi:hypothetical protein